MKKYLKKIRYLIIIIPVFVFMLFSQPNVSAVELGINVNNVYATKNGEPDWQEIFVIELDRTLTNVIQDMQNEHQLFILDNGIAIVDNNNNILIEKYVFYLYYDIGAGDGIIVLDSELFPYSIEDLYLAYGNDWSIIFTERKNESDYLAGYQQGKAEGYDIGYDKGWLDAYENINEDLPNWVLNGNLKLNDELYNYIDYDNLIFHENVKSKVIVDSDVTSLISGNANVDYALIRKPLDYINLNNYSNSGFILQGYVIKGYSDSLENIGTVSGDGVGNRFTVGFPKGTTLEQVRADLVGKTLTYELAEKQETKLTEQELIQAPFYDIGYWKGYKDGFDDEKVGFTGILTSIFSSFATLFAIELLPNITIGALILVPIVFGIIAFIIGRRKDD